MGRQSFASISKLIGQSFWTKFAGNHQEEKTQEIERFARTEILVRQ